MIIDAHQHFWDPQRGDYGWLEQGTPLYRRWMPSDLRPLMQRAGVGGTILVQAAPTMAETDWLLDIAEQDESVLAVVGWLDLDAPDLAELLPQRQARGLVGIRPMLQDIDDPEWILGSSRRAGLRTLAATGLAFDALVRPAGLSAITELADRHPDLRIVLDHAGKPSIGDKEAMDGWQRALHELSRRKNLWCKLSGLMTEAPERGREAMVTETIARLLDIWGPDRLIWGSDWPVLTLAGDYLTWAALARGALSGLSAGEAAAVFEGNARRAYAI